MRFPIGIQSFDKLRSGDNYYVDKTRFVHELANESGGYFFLSRPRRFGKSLFLDTLNQAFLGKKEYFKGLYVEEKWNWEQRCPVLHISFGSGALDMEGLHSRFEYILRTNSKPHDIALDSISPSDKFAELIQALSDKYQTKVVILIDEYDKPILDNITKPEIALEIREGLKNFYSVIKDVDRYLRFVFITGVTKFSKVSLFSGLNNLKDITLDPRYATICGYTQTEFETVFADRLGDVDLEKVKLWYNGYNFLGEKVYNPFDILLFLDRKEYLNYWLETGTPSFLIKLLVERKYFIPRIEDFETSDEIISSFDVDSIKAETLLFQAGYATLKSCKTIGARRLYRLTYPNLEVKMGFSDYLLNYFVEDTTQKTENQVRLYEVLAAGDVDKLRAVFTSFFASIPYDWYRKNELAGYEGYYASVFYSYFTGLGLNVKAEDTTSHGRIDMTVIMDNGVFIFEFKVVEIDKTEGSALSQIKQKRYHEKYLSADRPVYLIGAEFSRAGRNIARFEWERA